MRVFFSHESSNLDAPGSEMAARFGVPIQLLAMLVVAWRSVRADPADGLRLAGAAVLAFSVTGKVISPQYLIWVYPFVAAIDGPSGRVGRPIFLVASVLTLILYPWGFLALRDLHPSALILLNLRNLALVATLVTLLFLPGTAIPGDRLARSEGVASS